MSAVRNALQAPPFPLRLRPFCPPPRLLRKPDTLRLSLGCSPPPSEGCDCLGETEVVPHLGSREVSPPPIQWEWRGGAGREVEILVKSVAVPVQGLWDHVTGLAICVDEGSLAVTRPTPPLPVCRLDAPGLGLLTSTGTAKCARALGGRDDCTRDHLAVTRPGMTALPVS